MEKSQSLEAQNVTVIRPQKGWAKLNLGELWRYRQLLYFLAWRDLKVRYKQTVIGIAWAVLQPVLTMIVFSVIFGRFAKIPSEGVPYAVFSFCALLPWQLFSHIVSESANSVVSNQALVTKIYFPKLSLPLSTGLVGLVDFGFGFMVLLLLMIYYGLPFTMNMLSLPFFLLLAIATALGTGFLFSALNVRYRDVRYAIPFLIQFWFFLSPIAYPSSLIPAHLRPIYGLNPMAGVIEGCRWALFGTVELSIPLLMSSFAMMTFIIFTGLVYFRQTERTMADII